MAKHNTKLIIAYDGAAYAGWQIQPEQISIQAVIEQCLFQITREKIRIHSSGRTDRGVHAKAQVAHFLSETALPASKIKRGLNALLPEDIRIMRAESVSDDFHARFSAVSKEYRYYIWNADVLPPVLRQYRLHIRRKLNVKNMQVAASKLEGKNDFAAFTANPNRIIETTVRNLMALKVKKKGNEITIIAKGDGFLYKMVRSLAGGLVRVGTGELSPEEIQQILDSKVRTAQIPSARPHGLFLWNVSY